MKSLNKPSQHLLVQSQPWKHKNNVWNLLKVNKKDTKTTLLTTHCSGVSMVDFEQVNNGWDSINIDHLMTIWWSGVSIYPFGRAIHNRPLKKTFKILGISQTYKSLHKSLKHNLDGKKLPYTKIAFTKKPVLVNSFVMRSIY